MFHFVCSVREQRLVWVDLCLNNTKLSFILITTCSLYTCMFSEYLTQLEEMRSNHERHILENDHLLQEKEERITELLTNLKQLRGDIGSTHLPDGSIVASVGGLRPPGLARRTATIGVQTSKELFGDNSEAAVLPVDESVGVAHSVLTNGDRATMTSLGPEEEVMHF